MRTLGTIVEAVEQASPTALRCGMLDYYDWWNSVDPRLETHHRHLSSAAAAFGHDLVHQATYVHEILVRLPRVAGEAEVGVTVASMTEAFLVSVRSAYDAIAAAIAYIASEKLGQAPNDSLRGLANWAMKNPARVRAEVAELLRAIPPEFMELRGIRDQIVHMGASVTIHIDGRQFNFWLHGPKGWITREPLLPLLARHHAALIDFANAAAAVINRQIDLPADRVGSRILEGVFVSSLGQLHDVQAQYAVPSP